MQKKVFALRMWWDRRTKIDCVFIVLFATCVLGIILSLLHISCLKPSDGATLFAGSLAAAIVWWQGHLIRQQMQLQAIIELDKEWNSKEMLQSRMAAWSPRSLFAPCDLSTVKKEKVERVLEFLEKVSTFQKNHVISVDLIWDTFGWYLWRYSHYCREVIKELRHDWTPNHLDTTLYCHLQDLSDKLLACEMEYRSLTKEEIATELDLTKEKFVASERSLSIHD
jgi:hypothetical protein